MQRPRSTQKDAHAFVRTAQKEGVMDRETAVMPLLHSVDEVMMLTGLGRSVVYEKLKSGEIESVKVGARRLIPHDAAVRFVESLPRGYEP